MILSKTHFKIPPKTFVTCLTSAFNETYVVMYQEKPPLKEFILNELKTMKMYVLHLDSKGNKISEFVFTDRIK